ncbi:hypothetical protein A3758_13905 [Oleiphilus sp. HI0118]|nr:hypothetical protein A3758_13905 [Oleiphilus sp. HI0118]
MFILPKPLNLAKLLRQLNRPLVGLVYSENDIEHIYVKRIASLNALLGPLECSANNDQEYSLVFATTISEGLSKLKNTVLLAPKKIVGECSLYETLVQSNVVLAVDNPRLEFIRLAGLVEALLADPPVRRGDELQSVVYGKDCLIKQGAVIGQAGFGYERDLDGTPIRFPHFGRVVLGNHVEVGANTVISKGALEDTVIGAGTKIDDLVYIAHNCRIGKNVMIAGNATLCGGVHVGDGAWIGAGASIKQNIKVGEGAVVGLGAVVVKDVAAYSTVVGNPARAIDDQAQAEKDQAHLAQQKRQEQQTQGAA